MNKQEEKDIVQDINNTFEYIYTSPHDYDGSYAKKAFSFHITGSGKVKGIVASSHARFKGAAVKIAEFGADRKVKYDLDGLSKEVKAAIEKNVAKFRHAALDATEDELRLVDAIEKILDKNIPKKAWRRVHIYSGMSAKYIAIQFASFDVEKHGVAGQRPDAVSLSLDLDDMELKSQAYGGNGGTRIYKKPDPENPKERYLAMAGIEIPFRKPQKNEKAVLAAIDRFSKAWLQTLKDNKEKLYDYADHDYDSLLK